MEEHDGPYPKSTPPKATKRPTKMAGHALPASESGLASLSDFIMNGSLWK